MAIEYRVREIAPNIVTVESRRWDAIRSPNATKWRALVRLSGEARAEVQRWLERYRPGAKIINVVAGDVRYE